MSAGRITTGMALLAGLLLAAPQGAAQVPTAPPLEEDVQLSARGGVQLKVPKWKKARSGAAVAVYESIPATPESDGFHVLVVIVEEGPATTDQVDWEGIAANVVAAAAQGGTTADLKVAGDWAPAGYTTYKGQQMRGTVKVGDKTLPIEVIAMVKPGQLVTISVVTATESAVAPLIVAAVATSAAANSKK